MTETLHLVAFLGRAPFGPPSPRFECLEGRLRPLQHSQVVDKSGCLVTVTLEFGQRHILRHQFILFYQWVDADDAKPLYFYIYIRNIGI